MADLAKQIVEAAEKALDVSAFDDQSKAAAVAVLRVLSDGKSGTPLAYHERKLIAGLADQIEEVSRG